MESQRQFEEILEQVSKMNEHSKREQLGGLIV